MYKTAVAERLIRVNNPSIWRPVLDIRDAVAAYLRAIQADYSVSGVFNVASANCTVGQVADDVKEQVEALTGEPIGFEIMYKQDVRNYKVSIAKAGVELGFEPRHSVKDIVSHINAHRHTYSDFEADQYYNVRVFRRLVSRGEYGPRCRPVGTAARVRAASGAESC